MKSFPIQLNDHRHGGRAWIPWDLIEPHEGQALLNHGGQTLGRLAERGGLAPYEAIAVIEDRDCTTIMTDEEGMLRLFRMVAIAARKRECELLITMVNTIQRGLREELEDEEHVFLVIGTLDGVKDAVRTRKESMMTLREMTTEQLTARLQRMQKEMEGKLFDAQKTATFRECGVELKRRQG